MSRIHADLIKTLHAEQPSYLPEAGLATACDAACGRAWRYGPLLPSIPGGGRAPQADRISKTAIG